MPSRARFDSFFWMASVSRLMYATNILCWLSRMADPTDNSLVQIMFFIFIVVVIFSVSQFMMGHTKALFCVLDGLIGWFFDTLMDGWCIGFGRGIVAVGGL